MLSMLPATECPLLRWLAALWLLSEHSRLPKFTDPQGSWWMVFSRSLLASLLTLSPRGKWLRVFLCEDEVFPLWPRLPWVGFVALWLPVACTAWLPQQAAMLSAVLPKLSVFPPSRAGCAQGSSVPTRDLGQRRPRSGSHVSQNPAQCLCSSDLSRRARDAVAQDLVRPQLSPLLAYCLNTWTFLISYPHRRGLLGETMWASFLGPPSCAPPGRRQHG